MGNTRPPSSRNAGRFSVALSLAVLLAGLVWAQGPGRFFLRDRQGNMAVENMDSVVSEFVPGGGLTFQGSGRPVRGTWKSQGLEVGTNAIEGRALPFGEGGLYLDRATLSGSVLVAIRRTPEAGPRTENLLRTERVEFREQGPQALVEIPGRLELRDIRTGPDASHELVVTGSSGHIVLSGRDTPQPGVLRSSVLAGPVTVQLNQRSREQAGETTTVVRARGQRLTFDAGRREVRLTGDVEFDAEQAAAQGRGFSGVFVADSVTFLLDENNGLRSVRWEGSPGRGTMGEAPARP